jgi:AAA+ ATPase superfamily predicted ATPase
VNGNVESIFQKYIDKLFSTIKAYLILCGSHLHMMQELANNNSRPLFGRKTEEIKLEPLNYLDSCSMFEGV